LRCGGRAAADMLRGPLKRRERRYDKETQENGI
jgi:hypothetical protein